MAERFLKCPNCGANATNHENCEYCGSLLVRFVEKNVDLSRTSYLSNDKVYPGLIQNLKQHLQLQDAYLGKEFILTDIWRSVEESKKQNYNGIVLGVMPLVGSVYPDGQKIFPNITDQKGLCICICFDPFLEEGNEYEEFNRQMDIRLERFQQLDCSSLFMMHQCYYTLESRERKAISYSINFGQDVEGAARLISEIMEKVFLIPHDEKIDIFTAHGWGVEKRRENANKERGCGTTDDEDGSGSPWWRWIIYIIIPFIISGIFDFSFWGFLITGIIIFVIGEFFFFNEEE